MGAIPERWLAAIKERGKSDALWERLLVVLAQEERI